MKPILRVEIGKRYPAREGHGFSLDVDFAADVGITVLFGPSGAGKTTVLDCIAGLVRPERGRISIGEMALFDAAAQCDLRVPERGLGYVVQTLALFPHMTLRENIGYGLFQLPEAKRQKQVEDALEAFHIAHLSGARPDQVSGGERQRAALARSLVTRPRALLLDEPLSALDDAVKFKIIGDLLAWNAANPIPILYVSHSLPEVFALAANVVVMHAGRIVRQGTPPAVLANEREAIMRQLEQAG